MSHLDAFVTAGRVLFSQFKLRKDSRRLSIWMMVLVAAAFIISSAMLNATNRHATAVRFWSEQLSHLSLVLAEQATQSLVSAAVVLDALSDDMVEQALQADQSKEGRASDQALRKVLQDKVRVNRLIEAISFVLSDGRVVSSAERPPLTVTVDLPLNNLIQVSTTLPTAVYLGSPRFDAQSRRACSRVFTSTRVEFN